MPVIKHDDIRLDEVQMEGVANTRKANVIGSLEGWAGYTLRVFRIGPGGHAPRHQHDWEHVNYVIKGQGTLTVGDKTTELAAGDFAFVPPNAVHQFCNPGKGEFEFICIVPNRGA